MWTNKVINTAVVSSICFFVNSVMASSIPTWVTNPTLDNGFAAVDCVNFSGNWSNDSKLASANARIALAQQIEIQVQGLDETYDTRQSENDRITINTQFSSYSKQITKQVLSGSRIVKTDMVNMAGKNFFCALATLDPAQTESVFKTIVSRSNIELEPQMQSELFEQFKSPNGPSKMQNDGKEEKVN